MLAKLSFERFRGFKTLEAGLERVTVVLGRNSSGKIRVLHATRMVVEALDLALDAGAAHEDSDGAITVCRNFIVEDFARLVPVDDWVGLFEGGSVSEGQSLSVDTRFDSATRRVLATIEYGRNRQPKLTLRAWCADANSAVASVPKKSPKRPDLIRDALRRAAPRVLFVPAFYGVTRAEEHRPRGLMLRLLAGGDQGRVVRNLVVRLPADRFRGLNDFLQRAMRAERTERTAQDAIDQSLSLGVYFRDTNSVLELSSAGAGLVDLVALCASIAHFRDSATRECGLGTISSRCS